MDEFDEVFRELERAIIERKEIRCIRKQYGDKTIWIIEIFEPHTSMFDKKMGRFIEKIKRWR